MPGDLTELTLEQLGNLEVTSVSRKPEKLAGAPAAVFVITQDDIRRSGATTIPEALRLAPGVQVSRIDSSKWAIGIRGFASRLSRSVLVLIDGRSVYTPLFAGVYWEVQDLLLDDVERIEVIRGPGGTLWGANAVNGVINIITKNAARTQGWLLKAQAGNEEEALAGARYGAQLGEHGDWRVYGRALTQDGGYHPDTPEFDDWSKAQGGFRMDTVAENGHTLTVQGDAYHADVGQRTSFAIYTPPFVEVVDADAELSGANVLARYGFSGERTTSSLQGYFDRTSREEANFDEDRNTFDLDWQQRVRELGRGHELVWGLGYRISTGSTRQVVPTVEFVPPRRTEDVWSAFAEDEFSWGRGLHAAVGAKVEHNDYSGFEIQPTASFSWVSPEAPQRTFWTRISRAVRTPTRTDTDLVLTLPFAPGIPTFGRILGTKDFQSERVIAYEAGYRANPTPWLLVDVAGFYNDYKHLVSLEPGAPFAEADPSFPRTIFPFFEENRVEGRGYGYELNATFQPTPWWRLSVTHSWLALDLTPEEDSNDPTQEGNEGSAPRYQELLWSSFDLAGGWELDVIVRHVAELPAQQVPEFTELDVNVGFRPRAGLALSLIGKNLLDAHHPEFGPPAGRVEAERSILARITWTH